MKKKLIILFLLTVLFYWNCEKGFYADAPVNPDKQILLDYVNGYRSKGCKCGNDELPPVISLTWNDTLELVAKTHSNDMNRNDYFDHIGKDGSNPGDRISRFGYIWSTFGENISKGNSTEKAVIDVWIKSEGHCKNIMNGEFKEMGVGTSGSYWTQVFASH